MYPFISCPNHPKVQVRAYFNIIKKDGSSPFEKESKCLYLESNEGCKDKYVDIEDLLDEENGYLDNGALTVEYGVQVESVEDVNGIWRFNFFDLFFNWQNQDNMFDFIIRQENSYFGHKQIIKLHSKKISDSNKDWVRVPKSVTVEELVMCLQITHGVRLQITVKELKKTIEIASRFGFSNTVRYCEQQLIKMDEQTKLKLTRNVKLAVKFKLERYLNHSIKKIKAPERLMSILKKLNVEKMSSATMKTLLSKYLELIDFLE
ncbi:hypothetical protein CAEBREN_22188 [Caenorhabditis brenneri]|uniref:BTB domain-containing protein n=1 Tax=Caenorhabditis brenneri TaxID=135651 RepID=G0ND23_CAEBE|nr:hypothetical protein CAEBREN_22188 [Caenorhabditis brenneri]